MSFSKIISLIFGSYREDTYFILIKNTSPSIFRKNENIANLKCDESTNQHENLGHLLKRFLIFRMSTKINKILLYSSAGDLCNLKVKHYLDLNKFNMRIRVMHYIIEYELINQRFSQVCGTDVEKDTIIYIDQSLYNHSDFKHTKNEYPMSYHEYEEMILTIYSLARKDNLKLHICLHPKSTFSSSRLEHFDHIKVTKGINTACLNSVKAVLCHNSTSTYKFLVHNIPTFIVGKVRGYHTFWENTLNFSKQLDLPFYDLENLGQINFQEIGGNSFRNNLVIEAMAQPTKDEIIKRISNKIFTTVKETSAEFNS
jgi:hypothetical protein